MYRHALVGLRNLKRDFQYPRNIYASLRFFFLFSYFFGLTPYHIGVSSKTHQHFLRVSAFGYLNMCSRFLFQHVNFMYSILHEQTIISYFLATDVSRLTDSMQKFNATFSNLVTMGICFLYRKKLCLLIQQMHRAEERFYNVGVSFMQKYAAMRTNRFALILFALTIGYFQLCFFGILARNRIYASFPASVCYFSPHILVCGVVVMFHGIVYKLTQHFRALNRVK